VNRTGTDETDQTDYGGDGNGKINSEDQQRRSTAKINSKSNSLMSDRTDIKGSGDDGGGRHSLAQATTAGP
jgi:hypothetical protein